MGFKDLKIHFCHIAPIKMKPGNKDLISQKFIFWIFSALNRPFQLEVYICHNKDEDFKKTFVTDLEHAQVGVFVEY